MSGEAQVKIAEEAGAFKINVWQVQQLKKEKIQIYGCYQIRFHLSNVISQYNVLLYGEK